MSETGYTMSATRKCKPELGSGSNITLTLLDSSIANKFLVRCSSCLWSLLSSVRCCNILFQDSHSDHFISFSTLVVFKCCLFPESHVGLLRMSVCHCCGLRCKVSRGKRSLSQHKESQSPHITAKEPYVFLEETSTVFVL